MAYMYNPPSTINSVTDVTNDALRGVRRGSEEENGKVSYLAGLAAYLVSSENEIAARFAQFKGKRFQGLYLETSAQITRPQGIGFRPEGGKLPTPTAIEYVKMRLAAKKLAARSRITPEALSDMAGGAGSFKPAGATMLKGLREQLQIQSEESFLIGSSGIMGVINGTPGAASSNASAVPLHPISSRSYTASNFWKRGLGVFLSGLSEAHPFYKNQRLALVLQANGALGSCATHANGWASGDSLSPTAAEYATDNEVYVSAIDGSVVATPTVTVTRSATSFDPAAISGVDGSWIIPYGSRRQTQAASDLDRLDTRHGMSGAYDYFTDATIHASVFGISKASVQGLMPNVSHNSGTLRTFTDGYIGLLVTQARKRSGRSGPEAFTSWPTWREVAKEHVNLRRIEPVIGSGGTSAIGATPDGYMYIGGGGAISFFPHHNALDGDILIQNDNFEYVSSWNATKKPTRWIPDYDVEEDYFSLRGNVMATDSFSLCLLTDIATDATAP